MRRSMMMCCVGLAVAGFAVQAARADSLDDVKKKLQSQSQELQTLREEVQMTTAMPAGADKMTSSSTMEYARRAKDKWVYRVDTVMKMPRQEGQPGPESMKSTSIYDGQYVYTIMDQGGQKTAMKMKADQGGQKSQTEPTGLAEMEKHYDLKLLPDEKVGGKNTWVVEARPKPDQAQSAFDRMVTWYDQANGVAVKMLTYDKAGKPLSTMEVTKVEVNGKIPDERFAVPAGVQVTDMTAGLSTPPPAQDAGAGASQPAAQKDTGSATPPPAQKDGSATTPPPAQNEKPAQAKPSDKVKNAAKKGLKGLF